MGSARLRANAKTRAALAFAAVLSVFEKILCPASYHTHPITQQKHPLEGCMVALNQLLSLINGSLLIGIRIYGGLNLPFAYLGIGFPEQLFEQAIQF